MSIKNLLFMLILLIQASSFSQKSDVCNLSESKNNEINAVDANDFVCLA